MWFHWKSVLWLIGQVPICSSKETLQTAYSATHYEEMMTMRRLNNYDDDDDGGGDDDDGDDGDGGGGGYGE